MSRIWISFDEVKARLSIRETMEALGIPLERYTPGPNGVLTGPCPLPGHPIGDPNHRNTRQFRVDNRDGIDVFKCFSSDCNAGGSVIQFAMQMLGRDEAHVRYFFADHFGDRLKGRPPSTKSHAAKKEPCEEARIAAKASPQGTRKASASLPEGDRDNKSLQPMDHLLRLTDSEYLKQRGVSPVTIARFGVGYASRGRMSGYIAMPIYLPDQPTDEYPVVYLGRFASEDYAAKNKPKYLWGAPGFPKGTILVGLREAMEGIGDKPLVVVEGMFDLFRVVDCGHKHVAAVVGSDVSDDQARLLISLKRPIVLMFDSDESGRAGARKAAGKLIRDTSVRVVLLPEGKDPADIPVEQLRKHLSFLLL
jgi:DNA primase